MTDYNEIYKSRLAQIHSYIAAGETSVMRIINVMDAESLSAEAIDGSRALKEMDLSRCRMGYAFDGEAVRAKEHSMDVSISMHRAQVAALIRKYLPPGTQRIVELGSGIGVNLFWLWSLGGPNKARYVGFEHAAYGNQCLTALARLEQLHHFAAYEFNYYNADFSVLEDEVATLVFTVHSIEQIKEVAPSLIQAIKAIPGFQRCVHFEPVGFQIPQPQSAWLDYQNETWSIMRNGYNGNLMRVLSQLERDKEINVSHVAKHIGGLHAGNAASLIVWEAARR